MVRLECGDINNSNIIKRIADETRKKIINLSSHSQSDILIINILNSKNNENIDKLIAFLSLSDEFNIPMPKSKAELLYFVLIANRETKINITNMVQAKMIYEISGGDYRKIPLDEVDPKKARYTKLEANHNNFLLPGQKITWHIPVTFFSENGEKRAAFSGTARLAKIEINEEIYEIPRELIKPFFKDSMVKGRLICNSTDEVKMCFDQLGCNKELYEILKYVGFIRYKDINISKNYKVNVQDQKMIIYHKGDLDFAEKVGEGRYVVLPKVFYLSCQDKENYFIMINKGV